MQEKKITTSQALVEILCRNDIKKAFCVPGESYLPVLDALYDVKEQIQLITCRQEGGACTMAEAYGKLTGKPGICFVTRGPGATNASIGVHTAYQDSTPLILFIGQVGQDVKEREAFQEIDFTKVFAPITKWAVEVTSGERLPEIVAKAFQVATNGRPGPVVISLPEDILDTSFKGKLPRPYSKIQPSVDPQDMDKLYNALQEAKKPLFLLGGSGWSENSCDIIQNFSENHHIPVTTCFRCQDLFDNNHPHYAGDVGIGINPELYSYVKESDLLIAVGTRLDDITTSSYELITPPYSEQKLIHIHPSSNSLGTLYQADLLIQSSVEKFCENLNNQENRLSHQIVWQKWTQRGNDIYKDYSTKSEEKETNYPALSKIIQQMSTILPKDSIVTNGAGNYAAWLHRYYRYSPYKTQLAPTNGAMGYGVPAAVAAKAVYPNKTVVAFAGDGCFLMNGQELATAVQYDLPIIIIVVNNNKYGTIRMHQEKFFPKRVSGTDLINPDFALYAKSFGAFGEKVKKTEDFLPLFKKAIEAKKPTLLEIEIDPDQITSKSRL